MNDYRSVWATCSPPIPEPPRTVPSKPWISNNSISDENNKLTTIININNQQLKQLRMKYGIITQESHSFNADDSLIENIKLIDLKSSSKNIDENDNDSIQKKLHSLQSVIREELVKVETLTNVNKNKCLTCQNCTKQESISKELIDYFRKQDVQLREMNEKINQILNIYQNEKRTGNKHRKINDQPVLSILQCNSKEIAFDMKMDAKTNLKNYLDCSIEKVRRDLHSSIKSVDDQANCGANSKPDNSMLYSSILSQVNSVLARNGSKSSSLSLSDENNKKRLNHLYHSQQSIYIKKLASKYEIINDSLDDIIVNSVNICNQNKPTNKINNNIVDLSIVNCYGLSERNNSIATRNYLDRYGLIIKNNDDNVDTKRHNKILSKQKSKNACCQTNGLIDLNKIDKLTKLK